MLSLRQFDHDMASATNSVVTTGAREPDMVLEFGAQSSATLPSFLASFAHPVHVASGLSEVETDELEGGACSATDPPTGEPAVRCSYH